MAHASGEVHYKARGKLSDDDVELVRQLREQFNLSYNKIAAKFDTTKPTVQGICNYRRRGRLTDK